MRCSKRVDKIREEGKEILSESNMPRRSRYLSSRMVVDASPQEVGMAFRKSDSFENTRDSDPAAWKWEG